MRIINKIGGIVKILLGAVVVACGLVFGSIGVVGALDCVPCPDGYRNVGFLPMDTGYWTSIDDEPIKVGGGSCGVCERESIKSGLSAGIRANIEAGDWVIVVFWVGLAVLATGSILVVFYLRRKSGAKKNPKG